MWFWRVPVFSFSLSDRDQDISTPRDGNGSRTDVPAMDFLLNENLRVSVSEDRSRAPGQGSSLLPPQICFTLVVSSPSPRLRSCLASVTIGFPNNVPRFQVQGLLHYRVCTVQCAGGRSLLISKCTKHDRPDVIDRVIREI